MSFLQTITIKCSRCEARTTLELELDELDEVVGSVNSDGRDQMTHRTVLAMPHYYALPEGWERVHSMWSRDKHHCPEHAEKKREAST